MNYDIDQLFKQSSNSHSSHQFNESSDIAPQSSEIILLRRKAKELNLDRFSVKRMRANPTSEQNSNLKENAPVPGVPIVPEVDNDAVMKPYNTNDSSDPHFSTGKIVPTSASSREYGSTFFADECFFDDTEASDTEYCNNTSTGTTHYNNDSNNHEEVAVHPRNKSNIMHKRNVRSHDSNQFSMFNAPDFMIPPQPIQQWRDRYQESEAGQQSMGISQHGQRQPSWDVVQCNNPPVNVEVVHPRTIPVPTRTRTLIQPSSSQVQPHGATGSHRQYQNAETEADSLFDAGFF